MQDDQVHTLYALTGSHSVGGGHSIPPGVAGFLWNAIGGVVGLGWILHGQSLEGDDEETAYRRTILGLVSTTKHRYA